MPDPHMNFAFGTVATAPSPATSGLSLVLGAGQGALFPQPTTQGAFNVVIFPVGTQPSTTNAEIVRCTARSTDTLTILRAQEGTSARTVIVGDQVILAVTRKTLEDAERNAEPTILDTFAGADSSVLAAKNWANTFTGGATAVPTVQGQRARFVAGATGGYVAADNVIVAANVATFADGETVFKWEMGSANSIEHYLWVGLRGTQSAGTLQDGYFVLVSCGFGAVSMDLYKRVAGASTNLGSLRAGYSPSVGEKALFRLRAQGSLISAKIWAPEAPEPSSWTQQVTDTSVTAAGATYIAETGASAAVAGTNYVHRAKVWAL